MYANSSNSSLNQLRSGGQSFSILEVSFTQERERFAEESRAASKNILDDLSEGNEHYQEKTATQLNEKDMLLDSFEKLEIE